MARNAPSVDAYGGGGFRLAGLRREGSVLIVGDQALAWSGELSLDSLQPVFDAPRADVEMLVLGMGARNALPPRAIRDAMLQSGIGLEFLDTAGAARLYNLLTSEGRRVAAALIAI